MKCFSLERVPHTEVEKCFPERHLVGCVYHYMHAELCLPWNEMIYVNSEGWDSFHFCDSESKHTDRKCVIPVVCVKLGKGM